MGDVLREVEGVRILPTAPGVPTPKPGEDSNNFDFRVEAAANTWSRAARRRAKQNLASLTGIEIESDRTQLAVFIRTLNRPQSQNWYSLECTWLRGLDRSLFESFWAHVSRKVGAGLEKLAKD